MLTFKRKPKHRDFSAIETDMHAHIIPAVGDGPKDISDSRSLIQALCNLGFKNFFAMPHTIEGPHAHTKESLSEAYKKLIETNPNLKKSVKLSSKYHLDEHFEKLLASRQVLPLPENRLLIGFSPGMKFDNLEEWLFKLQIKGYQIVLAHPERYPLFHNNFQHYRRLKDLDIEFQLSALSLTSYYGEGVKSNSQKLIDNGFIDFIGTEATNLQHIELLKTVPGSKYFERLVDSGTLKNKGLFNYPVSVF